MNNIINKEKKSSLYLKLHELFTEKLGIKITPIRLKHFSKVPLDQGWTDPNYDPGSISWARYTGNIGIIPGRSNLLIIDCDTGESIKFFIELANRINLPTETLVVHTRRGAHYYYYCGFSNELEKKQFNDNSRNIKIDLLAGSKCQAVAPYSMLKLDAQGNILKTNAEDFILFTYEPTHIPDSLPSISEDQYQALLEELEKHVKLLPTFKEKPAHAIQSEEEERHLTDEEIEKLIEIVEPYFIEGQRQNLILYLAGFLRKELNVSLDSIYKLYENLQKADDQKDTKSRLAAIQKTFEKSLEDISGKAGVEQLLGEETASTLCSRIKQALGFQTQKTKTKKKKDDKILDEEVLEQLYQEMQNEAEQQNTPSELVYIEINRKSRKFARCNYKDLVIEYGAFEKNEFLDKYIYVVHHKTFNCCIDKIYAVENPLTGEKKYEIHFISKNPAEPHLTIKGSLQEIWEEMKAKTTHVLNHSVALNVLTAVLVHYLERGWYEKKREDFPPGFYYFDDKLTSQNFVEREYTKEELQKAALFLNEYIYSHPSPHLITSIIKAGLLLPFSFAQKQMVLFGKLRKRMRYLYLCGQTKSGKTTTAMLLSRIWSSDDKISNKISYASFCTEARAAKHLSSSTHILIVDEVNKDLETSTVKELLKYAQEDLIARIILSKAQKPIHHPALAGIIMTSNSHFPEDPALLERFHVFQFRKKDKISAIARAKYEKEDFKKLEPLGQFVWKYVKKHGLKDDYIEYATEILKAFYTEAKIKAEWLDCEFKDDTAATEEEREYNKEIEFFIAVQKFFNQHVKPRENTKYGRLVWEALKQGNFGRWIWVDDNFFLYISKDFLIELKRSYHCEIKDLEELAELTGWEKKRRHYQGSKYHVVCTTVMDFFYRMRYLPRLITAWEFEEWLTGKLQIKEEIFDEETQTIPLNDLPF